MFMRRPLSISTSRLNRAIVYSEHGEPAHVIRLQSSKELTTPPPSTVNLKFILSPINPADVNVVQGVYPSKPEPTSEGYFVGGNEGLARVTAVGDGVQGLAKGDKVVMTKSQMGTWRSAMNAQAKDVLKIPEMSDVAGATATVNPPTAYNMLHDFVHLNPGDWVLQNGANSAVGQFVIQIAHKKGFQTINFVRNRDNLSDLVRQLESIGATKVFTYDDLANKSLRADVKEWTQGANIRLALNCVGGKETSLMSSLLGNDAHLVSYGAMSKQPLSLPTSLFIFKNLTSHGFWQTRWYTQRTREEKQDLMQKLVDLKLKEPDHEIVRIAENESDETATNKMREIFHKMTEGRYGKKVLLRIDS